MKFRVVGADLGTGHDVEIIVEADDEVAAETLARHRNMLVSDIHLVRPEPSTESVRTRKQCPKCMEWIHKGATKCPHCQSEQPAPTWNSVVAVVFFGGLAIFCGTCSVWTYNDTNRPADSRKQRIEAQFSPWDGSHRAVTNHIKATMNAPDSYKHDETRYADRGDHLVVTTKYRGTNAFGGVVRNIVIAKVDLQGNVLEITYQGP